MKINTIALENFYCYYDKKTIQLKPGLNVILGENGEGKTKLFEGLEWLFSLSNKANAEFISAKRLNECEDGESFKVSVEVEAEQYGETRVLRKSFTVTNDEGKVNLGRIQREAYTINSEKGESLPKEFDVILGQLFPSQLRNYLLFKGEDQLNIFKDKSSLSYLLEVFSDAKSFEKYAEIGSVLERKAELTLEREVKRDKRIEKEYSKLLSDIGDVKIRMQQTKEEQKIHLNEIKRLEGYINEAERFVENAEALENVNKRIDSLQGQIKATRVQIKTSYTTYLYDEFWVLAGFEGIFNDFKKNVTSLNETRRRIEKDTLVEKGRKEAVEDVLEHGIIPLNYDVPNPEVMEELIKDQHCKVCNTPAPEGSPQLDFMRKRLENLIANRKKRVESENDKALEDVFKNNYTDELRDILSWMNRKVEFTNSRYEAIKDWIEFNDRKKNDLKGLLTKLEKEEEKRKEIIGESNLGEERLASVLANYNTWQKDLVYKQNVLSGVLSKLNRLETELSELEKQKGKFAENSSNDTSRYRHKIITQLHAIFKDTKRNEYLKIVSNLEKLSNEYFTKINRFSFTGTIELAIENDERDDSYEVDVILVDKFGKYYTPNRSLETSSFISILFAINEMARSAEEQQFPLILDAPTSSFGETKTADFIKVISEMEVQMIILLKDFLEETPDGKDLRVKDSFHSVFKGNAAWLKLDRTKMDRNDISTLNTNIIPL